MVNLWLMMRKPGVGWFAIPYAPITCWLLNGWLLYCMNWPTRNGHLWCGILEMEFSKSPYPEIVWKCTYMNKSHLGPRCGNLKVSEPPTCSRCCWSRYMHIYYVRVWYLYIYVFGCANQARVCTFVLHIWYCKSLQQHGVKVQTNIEGGCFMHHHVRTMLKEKKCKYTCKCTILTACVA
jgi:hypothetical protein